MKATIERLAFCGAFSMLLASIAGAVTVPFTEDFPSSSDNWVNFNASAFLTYNANGGPDSGSYASELTTFNGKMPDSSVILFRARTDFNASSGAFFGDWITTGARTLSMYVRQNTPSTLTFFARLAEPGNTPAAFQTLVNTPVPPNQWTKLSFDLSSNAQYDTFEGSDWNSIFSNINFISIGAAAPASLTTDSTMYKFDLDKVAVNTPEPSSVVSMMIGVGLLLAWAVTQRPGLTRSQVGKGD
jgi:hypothetical protein